MAQFTLLDRLRQSAGIGLNSGPLPQRPPAVVDTGVKNASDTGSGVTFSMSALAAKSTSSSLPSASVNGLHKYTKKSDLPVFTEVLTDSNNTLILSELERRQVIVALTSPKECFIGWINRHEAHAAYERARSLARERGLVCSPGDVSADVIETVNFDVASTGRIIVGQTAPEKNWIDLIQAARRNGVTDLHFHAVPDGESYLESREGGLLKRTRSFPFEMLRQMCVNLHAISSGHTGTEFVGTDIQNGKAGFPITLIDGRKFTQDVRWATAPTNHQGYTLVVRILGSEVVAKTFIDLGFTQPQQVVLESWCRAGHGLVAMCGTTGSGKSMTIKKMLETLLELKPGIAIHSIESPVEYKIEGVVQRAVTDSCSFAQLVIAEMRLNPNAISVGETRDEQTANAVIYAAQTGHWTSTTLHTGDPIGIVDRLMQLGIDPYTLSNTGLLRGLIHQALVPVLCPTCSVPYSGLKTPLSPLDLARFASVLGDGDFDQLRFDQADPDCPTCRGSGKKGLTCVASMVEFDYKMLRHVRARELPEISLYRAAQLGVCENPALSLTTQGQGVLKMLSGTISPRHYERFVGNLRPEITREKALKELGYGK